MMKKIFAVVLIVAFLMSSFSTISLASDYQGHWAEDVINKFVEDKIISGDESGNINPDVNILRSEFAKIINRFFEYNEKANENFKDVDSGKWYADEFLIARKSGYISGDHNGNANPESPVTRAEVCVILARILNLPAAENALPGGEDIPEWAKKAVNSVYKAGYIKGYEDGSLRVYANITRAEAISLISRCEAGKTPVQNSTPVNNNGNITGMGSGSGSGGGGGGGGGGSSAPVGNSAARIDIRNFDKETYKLDLNAYFIDEFVFILKVDGDSDNPYTYDKDDILPTKVSSGYTFNIYDIVFKTVKERHSNNEVYEIYIKGLASGNRADTDDIKVYEGNIVIDFPSPSGLGAAYNTDGTSYNEDEYILSWDVVDTASEYQWSLYNSEEDNAEPVADGIVTAESLEEDATVVSETVAIYPEWGERENLYFTVSAKDKETDIPSMPAEPKYLLLDAPEVTGITYEGDDTYKISYEEDPAADCYEVMVGDTVLEDGVTYIPGNADKVMTIKVKGYYEYNETKPSAYIYDFTYSGGDGEDAPYIITNPRQLKNIADNPDKSFILGCDIELEEAYNGVAAFSGILDGGGYTVDLGDGATQGIFATASNFTIKNLTVKGTVNATAKAGAFVGDADGTATFINCTNYADVTSKTGAAYVGGILGDGYDSCTAATFINCVNYGTIDTNGNTNNSSNGGIAGVGRNTEIKNSVNYGRIDGQNRAGGLIGWSTDELNVSNCANFGNITSKVYGSQVGGVVGYLSATSTGSVKNFLNAGQVNQGVTGSFNGTYANSLSISDCVNVGTTAYAMTNIAGAVTSNCYYLESKGADSTGATSKTSDEIKELTLEGFAKQDGYEYPLPDGIVYVSTEEANAVMISSAEEFMNIANDLSGTYKLTADITLSEGLTEVFSGIFDGNGHSITIGSESAPAIQGIFATASNFTIKNLTVKGAVNSTAKAGAAAFVGAATGTAAFINCTNYADVTSGSGSNYVGGILGNGYDGCSATTFVNCINYGTVDVNGNTNNNSNGGITGVGRNTEIENSVNYGRIDGQNRAGGLIGWSTNELKVSNCANFGKITSKVYGSRVGGVVGHLGSASTGAVMNFLNAGQVNYGVVGTYGGSPSISDCVNVGLTTNAMVGNNTVATSNCYYLEGKGSDSTGATSKTSDELKELTLEGYAKQAGYDYPLPKGIVYNPIVTE